MSSRTEAALDSKTFSMQIHGRIINFDVLPDRRVICPICRNIFKNICHHMQRSKCSIPNLEGFSENLKKFLNNEFREEIKRSQRERKAKFDAQFRKMNNDQLREKQRKWKAKSNANLRTLDGNKFKKARMEINAKSDARLRKIDNEKVKEQQKNWKAKSDEKSRSLDNEKFKERQKNWKAKSNEKLRSIDNEKFKADQNARKKLSRTRKMAMDPKGVTIAERKAQYKKKSNWTAKDRLHDFRESTKYNAIFICNCCHRRLFLENVQVITEKLLISINQFKAGIYRMCVEEDIKTQIEGRH